MEENVLTGHPFNKHQYQSPNVEETNTNTSTNWQQNIVEIEPTSDSDSEGSAAGGSAQGGTADIENEVDPTLCFSNIIPLLLHFS